MKVVIAGGGTAGHVNPALALARALDTNVTFVGTERGAETRLVPAAGFDLELLVVRGFDRARPWSLPLVGIQAVKAFGAAVRLLRRIDPDVVVGMGGYVSLPVGLAAKRLRIPLVIHEQNIVLGLANRVLKHVASRVAVSFEQTLPQTGPHAEVVGNPVAPELVTVDRDSARERGFTEFLLEPTRRTLLVFGGSQGARTINNVAAELAELWNQRSDFQVLHIAGSAQNVVTGAGSGGFKGAPEGQLLFRSVEFVGRMVDVYALADLALCRGGATTVAELAVMGLPAIIVPYPFHRDRQQEKHARVLEAGGAAITLLDSEATARRVAEVAESLLVDDARRERMSQAARRFARPNAAADLARLVREAVR
jgi:UDP-N-acetylglucosamine--N-acetylmuramyl-(pentapeptide) pyrophosphoryl-undecaprenol N-acetylglucosamine transferase